MNRYQSFVSQTAQLLEQAKTFPLGKATIPTHPKPAPDAPKVFLFSPHPDDEAIVGGLALRLLRESKFNVTNVAVTQGSDKTRQAARWTELTQCCQYLGFDLLQTQPNGLESINLATRKRKAAQWTQAVKCVVRILTEQKPAIIFFPHSRDSNSTHIGTHHLVVDALSRMNKSFSCLTVETEYWGMMPNPNLMVEMSEKDLADLMIGLTFHVGEMRRNAYHLRLPAWMIDNVRRGAELTGGQGAAAPDCTYATLYRVQRWKNGNVEKYWDGGRFLSRSANPASILG
jgi:N-acetylglucosamine malate deacetylase 1